MSRIKYATDSTFAASWAPRIGKLILNFACLELESHLWLVQLSERVERIPEFGRKRFRSRVDDIKEFVGQRAFSDDWKDRALEQWEISLELGKLRNRIAHNPLVFAWTDDAEQTEPDLIGIADMRAREPHGETQGPLMSREDVDAAINRIAGSVQNLAALRKEWCTIRDAKKSTEIAP